MERFYTILTMSDAKYALPPDKLCSHHCTLTTTLREFGSRRNQVSSFYTRYECDDDTFSSCFDARFYANGDSPLNEGYVSIKFRIDTTALEVYPSEFCFVASVIDADGKKRFPQTFSCVFDPQFDDSRRRKRRVVEEDDEDERQRAVVDAHNEEAQRRELRGDGGRRRRRMIEENEEARIRVVEDNEEARRRMMGEDDEEARRSLEARDDAEPRRRRRTRVLQWGFDKYIKRSSLLSDASQFLPRGSLTLSLEIDYEISRFGNLLSNRHLYCTYLGSRFPFSFYYISMDTEFGKKLCEMSSVIRSTLGNMPEENIRNPFISRRTIYIHVPISEERSLDLIFFLINHESLEVVSLGDVCRLCAFVYSYNMLPMMKTCRNLLLSLLCAISSRDILDCVRPEEHLIENLEERSEDLREIKEIYMGIRCEIIPSYKSCTPERYHVSNISEVETDWICECNTRVLGNISFNFSKSRSEHSQLEFYR